VADADSDPTVTNRDQRYAETERAYGNRSYHRRRAAVVQVPARKPLA
jgi:hypothetical protein